MTLTSRLTLAAALGATATSALADDRGWQLLKGITVDEIVTDTSYEVKKGFPERLRNGVKGMQLTGYAMPLTPGDDVRELVLVADMGICPFCGGLDHTATIQVNLDQPIVGLEEGARITLRGDMMPVRDPETWQAVRLDNAVLIDA